MLAARAACHEGGRSPAPALNSTVSSPLEPAPSASGSPSTSIETSSVAITTPVKHSRSTQCARSPPVRPRALRELHISSQLRAGTTRASHTHGDALRDPASRGPLQSSSHTPQPARASDRGTAGRCRANMWKAKGKKLARKKIDVRHTDNRDCPPRRDAMRSRWARHGWGTTRGRTAAVARVRGARRRDLSATAGAARSRGNAARSLR